MKNGIAAIGTVTISVRPVRHAGAPESGQLHARFVEDIGSRFVKGNLRPGDAPSNADGWSTPLGMSRTALPKSIKVLAGKRLWEVRPKIGMRVRARQIWRHLDGDILSSRSGFGLEGNPAALFELRCMVEPTALIATALSTGFRLSNDNPAGQKPSLQLHHAFLDAFAGMTDARRVPRLRHCSRSRENDVPKAALARRAN